MQPFIENNLQQNIYLERWRAFTNTLDIIPDLSSEKVKRIDKKGKEQKSYGGALIFFLSIE